MSKIKDEELKQLQELTGKINNLKTGVGELEYSKLKALEEMSTLDSELREMSKTLTESYGEINLNLSDGSYEIIEENQSNLKTV